MGVKSRRSSDSSVVSSPFKVLPPIPNVSEESDKEEENEKNRTVESVSQSNDDQDHDVSEKEVTSNVGVPKTTLKVFR